MKIQYGNNQYMITDTQLSVTIKSTYEEIAKNLELEYPPLWYTLLPYIDKEHICEESVLQALNDYYNDLEKSVLPIQKWAVVEDDRLLLQNCEISNAIIENLSVGLLEIQNCVLHNVTFQGNNIYCRDWDGNQFVGCHFQSNLDNQCLSLGNNFFTDCTFEKNHFWGYDEQSDVNDCHFENCIFTDMDIQIDLSMGGLDMNHCSLKKVLFTGNLIYDGEIKNSSFQEVTMQIAVEKTKFDQDSFCKVNWKGLNADNEFLNCSFDLYEFSDTP